MWLLNTTTQRLEFCNDSTSQPYAILSHRWETDEISHQDMLAEFLPTSKKGWKKVLRSCETAAALGLQYIWIDTCCIDKKSSAELSEAINSMYTYYANSKVCFAYLYDADSNNMETFDQSTWFTRSWTLQELLAPQKLTFFDVNWNPIGTKATLTEHLWGLTHIPVAAIENFKPEEWSINLRMSWASHRTATRIEDVSYSLLGIFDINMALLYGEGANAFQRLQEEIMRTNNDLSLFIWRGRCCPRFGVLAASPANFSIAMNDEIRFLHRGYSFNNAGLSLSLNVTSLFSDERGNRIYAACLDDPVRPISSPRGFRMFLKDCGQEGQYRRVCVDGKWYEEYSSNSETIYSTREVFIERSPVIKCHSVEPEGVVIRGCPDGVLLYGRLAPKIASMERWMYQGKMDPKGIYYKPIHDIFGMIGYISWERHEGASCIILCFGFDFNFNLACLVLRIRGPSCHNPMQPISPCDLMNKYLSILPETSPTKGSYDEHERVYATRGKMEATAHTFGLRISADISPSKPTRWIIDISDLNRERRREAKPTPRISREQASQLADLLRFSGPPSVRTMQVDPLHYPVRPHYFDIDEDFDAIQAETV